MLVCGILIVAYQVISFPIAWIIGLRYIDGNELAARSFEDRMISYWTCEGGWWIANGALAGFPFLLETYLYLKRRRAQSGRKLKSPSRNSVG